MSLRGVETLERILRETPDLVRNHLQQIVARSTFAIHQRMRSAVPVDTGTLQRNITSTTRGLVGKVEIGVDAFYWTFLEYGTVNLPARPFIRPAVEEEAPQFERSIGQIGRDLERAFGSGHL